MMKTLAAIQEQDEKNLKQLPTDCKEQNLGNPQLSLKLNRKEHKVFVLASICSTGLLLSRFLTKPTNFPTPKFVSFYTDYKMLKRTAWMQPQNSRG